MKATLFHVLYRHILYSGAPTTGLSAFSSTLAETGCRLQSPFIYLFLWVPYFSRLLKQFPLQCRQPPIRGEFILREMRRMTTFFFFPLYPQRGPSQGPTHCLRQNAQLLICFVSCWGKISVRASFEERKQLCIYALKGI